MNKREQLQTILKAGNVVFFGGAGVSTESGIPDFRSAQGIFRKDGEMSPEEIVSSDTFWHQPAVFYDFYFHKMVYPNALPNPAHQMLAKLEASGLCKAVITQNIDGLHQLAGSKHVLELHGSIHHNTCTSCGKRYSLDEVLMRKPVPHCDCGGMIKPDVVLYGEALRDDVMREAIQAIASANTIIVGGTSLVVYPAAGLLQYFRGSHIVLINKATTSFDEHADLIIHEPIGEVLQDIL